MTITSKTMRRAVVGIVTVVVAIAAFALFSTAPEMPHAASTTEPLAQAPEPAASIQAALIPPTSTKVEEPKAAVPIKPTPALNFDRSKDLYKVAVDSINQSDPISLYNGWQATSACLFVLHGRAYYEQVAASERSAKSAAAKDLLNRCQGFFDNDLNANTGLLKRFNEKLSADSNHYFSGVSRGEMTQSHVDEMLAAGDWSTFKAMQSQLMPSVSESLGIANTPQETYLAIAWLQAVCDIGRDCSAQDVMYVRQCADHGKCPGSVEVELSEGLAPSQLAEVQKYRKLIAEAFLNQNARFFTLRPVR